MKPLTFIFLGVLFFVSQLALSNEIPFPKALPTECQPANDHWSCGPCSAAKVLRFYGTDTTYPQFKKKASNLYHRLTGYTPPALAKLMNQLSTSSRFEVLSNQTLETLKATLSQNKPAILLIKVGMHRLIHIPALHFEVVLGFNPVEDKFLLEDTDGIEVGSLAQNSAKNGSFPTVALKRSTASEE